MAIATRAIFTGALPDAPARGLAREIAAANEGGWTWFNDPRAIRHGARIFTGWITGDGHPMAAHYDLATRTLSTPQRLYPAAVFEVDDHDNPAFLRRSSDGRILAFFSGHVGNGTYVNVSTNPNDASSWAGPTNISAQIGGTVRTYVCPVELPNGTIRLFFREHTAGIASWRYTDSTDGGVTWSSRTTLADPLSYLKPTPSADGTRIDFVASGHPAFDSPASIWHFYWEGGGYFKSDGSSAGSLPLDTSDMTLVYDGTTTKSWLWDIAPGPVIAYATFPGGTGTDHRANVARYSSGWSSSEVALMGPTIHPTDYPPGTPQDFYSPGIAIDRADTEIVYVSRQVGSDWHLFRYPGAVQLTEGSGKRVRPAAIVGGSGVVAMSGTYSTYIDYDVGTIKAGG